MMPGGRPRFKGKPSDQSGDRIALVVILAVFIAVLLVVDITPPPPAMPAPAPPPSPTPLPRSDSAAGRRQVDVEPALADRVFNQPVEMLTWPDGEFIIAEKMGQVTRHREGQETQMLLDLTGEVEVTYQSGLLSIALDPEFARRPFLYAYYSVRDDRKTRLSRFAVAGGAIDRTTELILLELPQPSLNHIGGAIRFGPDGMLYLGFGSGGRSRRDDSVRQRVQRMDSLYGKIIRIDVRDSSPTEPYRVPEDNPLAGLGKVRGEIYAWGFRNPWRMAFDPENGNLWVGDVGEAQTEEINLVQAKGNYGWGWSNGDNCALADPAVCSAPDLEEPIVTYSHDSLGGCAVVGGVPYRGDAFPWLRGQYLFGDFCSGRIWALAGSLESGWAVRQLIQLDPIQYITSFAADDSGEVYALTAGGGILKLVPAE